MSLVNLALSIIELMGIHTSPSQEFQLAVTAIEKCRVPVIAAVHGIAYGLAVDMLSACDIRYATSNAIFSIKVP